MEESGTVLVVDDNENDVFLFRHALKHAGLPFEVRVARNGLEGVQYLEAACECRDPARFPLPKFIVTDNRMPVMTGKEFLQWLRDHPRCRVIPTVILGGSGSPAEVKEAYDLGAHTFFVKPPDHAALQELVKMIFHYWAAARVPATMSE